MPKTILTKLKENPDYLKESVKISKEKAKKGKFKLISFKIPDAQKEALEVICRRQKTTPVRFLKSVIKKQTSRYKPLQTPISYVTENQLQLFDIEPINTEKRKKK